MINERLRQVRKILGYKQNKFADELSISPSYLAGLESGDKTVKELIIKIICAQFNVNIHWLKTGEGSMFNDEQNARIVKVINIFNSLGEHSQNCAIKQLEEISNLEEAFKTSNLTNI